MVTAKIRGANCTTEHRNQSKYLIIVFIICAIPLWLWTTGNGRYGLPILLLIGPLLSLMVYKALSNEKLTIIVLSVVLILQSLHALSAGNPRWTATDWTRHWFEVSVPSRLKNSPYGYLSLGLTQSNSVLAPFLHPDSSFVSVATGAYAFRPDGPGNNRIHQFIKVHSGNLRMLIKISPELRKPTSKTFDFWDAFIAPWKLKIVRSDCEFIDMTISLNKLIPYANQSQPQTEQDTSDRMPFLSCALEAGEGEDKETLRQRKQLSLVFDRIEESCPLLFSPRGWQLTKFGFVWRRHYLQSDIVVSARNGRLSLSKYDFGPFNVDMGSVDDWENGHSRFVCEQLPKRW